MNNQNNQNALLFARHSGRDNLVTPQDINCTLRMLHVSPIFGYQINNNTEPYQITVIPPSSSLTINNDQQGIEDDSTLYISKEILLSLTHHLITVVSIK